MTNITIDTRFSSAIEGHNSAIQTLMVEATDLASNLSARLKGYTALTTLLDGFDESTMGNLEALDLAQLLQQVTTNAKAVAEELEEVLDKVRDSAQAQGHLLETFNVLPKVNTMQPTETAVAA